jgi:hypothetical protein
MLVALYSLPYRPNGLEVELRSKVLALSTPRKVPSSATNTGGFAWEAGGTKVKIRSIKQWKAEGSRWKNFGNRFMGFLAV